MGHPEVITSDFGDIRDYLGIAKVTILAPRGQYHPSCRTGPTASSCADSECGAACHHTDEQRTFMGTWCTPEIVKALEKGYRVHKIYEVYHWEDSIQSDRTTEQGGLFATYVNTFLKFKQEASGWAEWCRT